MNPNDDETSGLRPTPAADDIGGTRRIGAEVGRSPQDSDRIRVKRFVVLMLVRCAAQCLSAGDELREAAAKAGKL